MSSQFTKAVDIVKNLPKADGTNGGPSDSDKLIFYANYKQATEGDCTTAKPGMFDFVGKAKWEAWTKVKGTSKEDAEKAYVAKLKDVLSASSSEEAKASLAELEAAA